MGQAGRHYLLSHFTPDLIAKQYSKLLYEAVLNQQVEPSNSMTVGQVASESLPLRKEI
jgi:hypothetical protein